jgi:hypothetical protein
MTSGPRFRRRPGPVAEQTCCGADPFPSATVQGTPTLLGLRLGPPCVCRPDVIEVTHGLAAAANKRGWSRVWRPGWRSWRRRSHSSRTLWPGGSRSEWRPGWWPSASAHHPERAWSLLVRLAQKRPCQVRNIALAVINAHGSRLSPAEVEIPARSRCICPTAYPWSVPGWTGSSPPAKVRSDRGSTRPCV